MEEYRQLQLALLLRPTQGEIIRGSGGLQDSLAPTGYGETRRITSHLLLEAMSETFYMLTVYRKNDQEDLTPKQVAIM